MNPLSESLTVKVEFPYLAVNQALALLQWIFPLKTSLEKEKLIDARNQTLLMLFKKHLIGISRKGILGASALDAQRGYSIKQYIARQRQHGRNASTQCYPNALKLSKQSFGI